ncbi:hypothetical protein [Ahrensia kielensis]|uniref:hypothetical protein n=1 Tax=Ahrensia kielensis TaxID=76980 RepID=UPI000370AF54|nr:hypothetical protein [Ahrensia kielensis]
MGNPWVGTIKATASLAWFWRDKRLLRDKDAQIANENRLLLSFGTIVERIADESARNHNSCFVHGYIVRIFRSGLYMLIAGIVLSLKMTLSR